MNTLFHRTPKTSVPYGSQYEVVECKVGIGINAYASHKRELFEHCALALMNYIFGNEIYEWTADREEEISIHSSDREALLIEWLSELLSLTNSLHRAYVKYDIKRLAETELRCSVHSVFAQATNFVRGIANTGVEYRKERGVWHAKVRCKT